MLKNGDNYGEMTEEKLIEESIIMRNLESYSPIKLQMKKVIPIHKKFSLEITKRISYLLSSLWINHYVNTDFSNERIFN